MHLTIGKIAFSLFFSSSHFVEQLPCVMCLVSVQHYMLSSVINDQLAGVAGVVDGDFVLEIGPGTGSLTNVLLDAGASVFAIEKVWGILSYQMFLLSLER